MPKRSKNRGASAAASATASVDWRTIGALALLAVAVFIAYMPAMNGEFVWDDDAHVPREELRSLDGLRRIWFDFTATQQWYPLLFSWFWLQWQLWGDHTVGYHIVTVLLHIGNAFLFYAILRKLKIPGAYLAAAIFALHPVHVESVAWITEQKNTLSGVFFLGAILTYLYFDDTRQPRFYALALVLFVLGLLSKTVTATMPPVLLVIFWWQHGTISWRRDVMPLLPFFGLAVIFGAITTYIERVYIGAQGSDFDLNFVERLLVAGRVPWFYASKLIWPANLMFFYPRWRIDASDWTQWLYPLATVGLLVALWMIHRRTRGPLAAVMLFIGTLVPVLGFLNVYWFIFSYVGDHLQYVPSMALIALGAAGITLAIARLPPSTRWLGTAVCIAILLGIAAMTSRQSEMYTDPIKHYTTVLDQNPRSWLAHENLGVLLSKKGRTKEAIERYEKALSIRPRHAAAYHNLGESFRELDDDKQAIRLYQRSLELKPTPLAHFNLGSVYERTGQLEKSAEQFRLAVQMQPDYLEARHHLAQVALDVGNAKEAVDALIPAIKAKPDYAPVYITLGSALLKLGLNEKAIESFNTAVQLRPDLPGAHYELGNALRTMGREAEALEEFRLAVAQNASFHEAALSLGTMLLSAGKPQEAVPHLQRAVELKPDYAEAHNALASALDQVNRTDEAIVHLQKAVQLDPSSFRAHNNLGNAVRSKGQLDEAISQYLQAIRIKPDYSTAHFNMADTLLRASRPDEAMDAAQKALTLSRVQSDSNLAQEVAAWLDRHGTNRQAAFNPPSKDDPPGSPE